MNIAVTGFYGTGSSAVIDLLSEYDFVSCAIGNRYEHYSFSYANCLFDLENRIFSQNSNYMIIDRAINDFEDEMLRQNNYNFGWYGSYKEITKDKFKNLVLDFINSISEQKEDRHNFCQAKGVKFSLGKAILQVGASVLKGYKIKKLGRVYVYGNKPRRFLKVDHEEFMECSRKFIKGYFDLFETNNNMIYDHLLLPEQAGIVDKFFDDDFRLIVVDRDPRDIYISDKFIWSSVKFGKCIGPFPNSLESFCSHWKNMHNNINHNNLKENANVLHIYFEDLVYNYEETVKKIENFCSLKPEEHTKKLCVFDPKKSIHNTQVFKMKPEYGVYIEVIEKELKNFLYKFPYEIKNDASKIFD